MSKTEWRRHPDHGHMLLGPIEEHDGKRYRAVVTSLMQHNLETEMNRKTWENQKLRLHVNAGCGQIAAELHLAHDINPAFVHIDGRKVPKHIRDAFKPFVEEG